MVTWQFNRDTKQADILVDGVVVESVELAKAAARVTIVRGEVAKASPVACVEASAYKRRNRSH